MKTFLTFIIVCLSFTVQAISIADPNVQFLSPEDPFAGESLQYNTMRGYTPLSGLDKTFTPLKEIQFKLPEGKAYLSCIWLPNSTVAGEVSFDANVGKYKFIQWERRDGHTCNPDGWGDVDRLNAALGLFSKEFDPTADNVPKITNMYLPSVWITKSPSATVPFGIDTMYFPYSLQFSNDGGNIYYIEGAEFMGEPSLTNITPVKALELLNQ